MPRPMTQSASTRYRTDIDGLRAIAVVAVVLFHVGLPFADGGFTGVETDPFAGLAPITRIGGGEVRVDWAAAAPAAAGRALGLSHVITGRIETHEEGGLVARLVLVESATARATRS